MDRLTGLIERLVTREQNSITTFELNRLIGRNTAEQRVSRDPQLAGAVASLGQREGHLRRAESVGAASEERGGAISVQEFQSYLAAAKRIARFRIRGDDSHRCGGARRVSALSEYSNDRDTQNLRERDDLR